MSALKLSATACNYVRTATTATATATAKTKPLLLLSWTPNTRRTYHHHHHPGRRITPCAHVAPHSKVNNIPFCLGRKGVSSLSPDKSGFLGCGSASPSPSPSPSRHGLVTHDSSQNEPQPPVSTDSESESQPEPEPSKLLTLPTVLTLGRVAAVPLLVATFYMDGWRGTAATTSIFIAAAATDWLDGYIARKMKLKSSFGAFLDPVADKLMVAATLVLLCSRPLDVAVFGQAPWLLTVPSIAIIGREITMSAVREWAASQDSKLLEAVAVNNLGKWKTATQMTALTILLATRDWSHGGAAIVVGSGVVLLYTSAGLAVWSLVVYMRKIWRVLLR